MEKRIQSIQRAVDILNCFSEETPNLALNQISQRLSLNINTVRGLVNTLVANGLITHNAAENTYSLGLYFVLKSNLVYETRKLGSFIDMVKPYLQTITEKHAVFSSIQIVNQSNIFMIETMQPSQSHYKIMAQLYSPIAFHCTSSGKLYLQYLPDARRSAVMDEIDYTLYTPYTIRDRSTLMLHLEKQKETIYSTEFDELAVGISSIAAPVLLPNNRLFGTISVTAPSQIIKDNLDAISSDLIAVGKIIAANLSKLPEML